MLVNRKEERFRAHRLLRPGAQKKYRTPTHQRLRQLQVLRNQLCHQDAPTQTYTQIAGNTQEGTLIT